MHDTSGSCCAFCGTMIESVDHLFVSCGMRCLGGWSSLVAPQDVASVIGYFKGIEGSGRDKIVLVIVWHVLCTIWKFRNDLNFSVQNTSMEQLVDRDKFSSWKWFLTKNPRLPCSSYSWEGEQHVMCWHQWEGVRWVNLNQLGLFTVFLWFLGISSLVASLGGLVFCWGFVWCLCVDVVL